MNKSISLFLVNVLRSLSKLGFVYLFEFKVQANGIGDILYSLVIVEIFAMAFDFGQSTLQLNMKNYGLDGTEYKVWCQFSLLALSIGVIAFIFFDSAITILSISVAHTTIYWSRKLAKEQYDVLGYLSGFFVLFRLLACFGESFNTMLIIYHLPDMILLMYFIICKTPFNYNIRLVTSLYRLFKKSSVFFITAIVTLLVRRADVLVLKELLLPGEFDKYMILVMIAGYIPLVTSTLYNRFLYVDQVTVNTRLSTKSFRRKGLIILITAFLIALACYLLMFWDTTTQWFIISSFVLFGTSIGGLGQLWKVVIHRNRADAALLKLFIILLFLSPTVIAIGESYGGIIGVGIAFFIIRLISNFGHKKIARAFSSG